ncbi:MAG: rRNA adenine N-6-methyltransferase family protein [Planctomycetota bacterium]
MRTPGDGPQQHDLDPAVAERMVKGARIVTDELVLDAGAGLGAISAALVTAGSRVAAVELDMQRVAALRTRFTTAITEKRIEVIKADVRRWRPPYSRPWRVIANPPFNLTAELVRNWIIDRDPPRALDLILQHETAEKLCGTEGRHTRSSALLACAGEATFVARLPREATTPSSRVDLAVWRFRRDLEVDAKVLPAIDRLLTKAFAGPRTMTEALRGVASSIQLRRQGAEFGWKPEDHPRTLPAHAWPPLASLLVLCGKI